MGNVTIVSERENMKWNILSQDQRTKGPKDQKLNKSLTPEEIIAILLQNRGLKTKKEQEAFLNPSLKELDRDFFDKKQLKAALVLIKKAITENELIIVYTDYDVDGITGGAILWETLHRLGARTLPYVPHRIDEGYGMSKKGIDSILTEHPDAKLIITVDHGITAVDQTVYAKEKGLAVIITDHHTVGKEVPEADAIIHTTDLAGSGVAFVFARNIIQKIKGSLLRSRLRNGAAKDQRINEEYLALAALGTIADLVPLVGANRVIARFGLEALNKTQRVGLLALINEVGLVNREIGTYEVGFMIAPRINASGRISHALEALRLLCTNSPRRARELATLLNQLNIERQQMMKEVTEHAKSLAVTDEKLLFIAHESYHEGIIGLIAGNLVDEFYRPAIVLSKGAKYSKASARSISGFNIIEAIRSCSAILVSAGGHPMAAGFTVETRHLSVIEDQLRRVVTEQLADDLLERQLRIDRELPLPYITQELYEMVSKLKPYGMGNPEPVFMSRAIDIIDAAPVGVDKKHLRLRVAQQDSVFNAIAFNRGDYYMRLSPDVPVDIAYSLLQNTWNGHTKLELKIRDILLRY